jgi:hypothetical protein
VPWEARRLPGKFARHDRFVKESNRKNKHLFVAQRIKAGDGSQSCWSDGKGAREFKIENDQKNRRVVVPHRRTATGGKGGIEN